MGSFLDILLQGIKAVWWNNASVGSTAPTINFLGSGVTDVVFNPAQNTTDVTISGGGGGGAARQPLPYTTIYIDPSNVTGNANDANAGTSPSLPIRTTVHLNFLNLLCSLTANTTINYLSVDASGTGLDISTMSLGAFSLTINQTRQVIHTGGTLNAGTLAINPSTNQAQVVHTSDIGSFTTLLYSGAGGSNANWTRIIDETTTAGAWLYFGAGSATAEVSRPVLPNGNAGALTSGNAYTITTGGALTLAATPFPVSTGGAVIFNDCAFTAGSAGPQSVGGFSSTLAQFNRCSFLGPLSVSGSFSDCAFADGMQGSLIVSLSAGVLMANNQADEMRGTLNVSGDTVCTGPGSNTLTIGSDYVATLFISEGIGSGMQCQRNATAGIQFAVGGNMSTGNAPGTALLWGKNNGTYGMIVAEGTSATVSNTVTPTVTGTSGDFALSVNGAPVAVARAFDNATGAYTEAGAVASRTCTWAHFAAAIGSSGFNFGAHRPESRSSLVATSF